MSFMAEQFYKEFFEEALNQIREELGNEKEFRLWYNLNYVGETDDSITVTVQSDVMWKLMNKNGIVEKIQQKINEFTGTEIKLTPAPRSAKKEKSREKKSTPVDTSIMGVPETEFFNGNPPPPPPEVEKKRTRNKGDENRFSRAMSGLQSMIDERSKIEGGNPQSNANQEDVDKEYAEFLRQAQKGVYSEEEPPSQHPQLREDYTFENFIPDNNLMLAYNTAKRAAEDPGSNEYNPILFYGGVGLGKTHLMQAIGNEIYARNPKAKICYISAESFTNEFTSSLSNKTTEKFKKKYRNLDVLLLDDIQFLEKKEATQEELFHTFNAIYDRKGQLVFTSDRSLKEIQGFTDRLRTRFGRGLDYDLQLPDFETRCAILMRKINGHGKEIPKDVIEYIAQSIQSNIRDLESCALKVMAYCDLSGQPLSLDVVRDMLKDRIDDKESAGAVTVDAIQQAVSKYFGIKIQDITGKTKTKQFVFPRHIAIYLSRKLLREYSLKDIGREFGGKDHTTIMNSINKIDAQIKTNPAVAAVVRQLEKEAYNYI